jgi:hypothetical protein
MRVQIELLEPSKYHIPGGKKEEFMITLCHRNNIQINH